MENRVTTLQIFAYLLRINKPRGHFSLYLTWPLTAEWPHEPLPSLQEYFLPQHIWFPSGQPLVSPLWILLPRISLLSTWNALQTLTSHLDLSSMSRAQKSHCLKLLHVEISHQTQHVQNRVLLVLTPVQLCGANPIWKSQPHPCLRPSPPYQHPFKKHALAQHHSKGFTSFPPHSHLLPELKSPPSLILSKARASIAGLSHPGGRWVWDHTPAWGTRWSQSPLLMTPLPCHGPSLWKVYKLHRFSTPATKRGCNFQSVEGKFSDLITLIILWHAATCQTEHSVYHTGSKSDYKTTKLPGIFIFFIPFHISIPSPLVSRDLAQLKVFQGTLIQ